MRYMGFLGDAVLPPLPTTGSGMDPVLKNQFIAAVPALSVQQQQDLYDIGSATGQATTARYMYLGIGGAVGLALGYAVSRLSKKRK